jgi:hypothetical protein
MGEMLPDFVDWCKTLEGDVAIVAEPDQMSDFYIQVLAFERASDHAMYLLRYTESRRFKQWRLTHRRLDWLTTADSMLH